MFGVPLFLIYVMTMFFILMNIFLAILGEAYTVVREEATIARKKQARAVEEDGIRPM